MCVCVFIFIFYFYSEETDRQIPGCIPGLATGAVGQKLASLPSLADFQPRGRFVDTNERSNRAHAVGPHAGGDEFRCTSRSLFRGSQIFFKFY